MASRLVAAGVAALVCGAVLLSVGVASADGQEAGESVRVPFEDAVLVDVEPDGDDAVTVYLPVRSTDDPKAAAGRLADDASIPVHQISVRTVDARITQYVNGQLVEGGELYRTEIRTEIDTRTGPLGGTVPGDALTAVAPTETPAFVLDVPPGTTVSQGSVRSRSFSTAQYELTASDVSGEDPITYRFPIGSINALAALLLVSSLGTYAAVRFRARSVADGPEPVTDRIHAVRTTRANALLFGSAAAAGIALWLGSHSLVSLAAGASLPAVPTGAWRSVTQWAVALAPFVCGVWLATTLATEPVVRDLTDTPYNPLVSLSDWGKSAVFRLGRYWAAGVVLLTLAPTIVDLPLLGGVVVASLLAVDQFLRPLAVRAFNDTSAVTGEAGDELTEFCDRQDVSVRGIRLLDTDDARHADALAVGFAGYYWLFLTDDLLAAFDAEEIRALVAHELGHVRHRHLYKQALFTLGYWAIAFTVVVGASLGLWAFVAVAWAYRLGLQWFARHQEYQADEYAATATSPDTLAEALDRVGSVNFAWRNGGIAHDYGAYPPPIDDRIARLREDNESAEEVGVETQSAEASVSSE
ncbi:M48 family metalloprotease [Halosimplex sp. TS25]|uniref:M48 family metalloprotease n=1 Tax=Halosimplex rarum TaxID=3396619 RepID=UPI0039ECBD7C